MKLFIFLISVILVSANAMAYDTKVNGYYRSNGSYVQSYHRTSPDNTINNNYGTQGNVNPYTGSQGTVPRNYSEPQGAYNSGNNAGAYRTYNIYHPYGNQAASGGS